MAIQVEASAVRRLLDVGLKSVKFRVEFRIKFRVVFRVELRVEVWKTALSSTQNDGNDLIAEHLQHSIALIRSEDSLWSTR